MKPATPRPLTREEEFRAWVDRTAYAVKPKPAPQQPAPKAG